LSGFKISTIIYLPPRVAIIIDFTINIAQKNYNMEDKIIIRVAPEIMDLVPDYISHRKRDIAAMRVFLIEDKFEDIKTLGHKFKGVGKLYSMEQVTLMGDKIEKAAIAMDKMLIAEALAVLEDYFERVEVVL